MTECLNLKPISSSLTTLLKKQSGQNEPTLQKHRQTNCTKLKLVLKGMAKLENQMHTVTYTLSLIPLIIV